MSDYWKKKMDKLEQSTSQSYWDRKVTELENAQKRKTTVTTRKDEDDDIAPVKKEEERTWFQKGAFEDGFSLKNIGKAIIGSAEDLIEDVGTGIVGMGEKLVDSLATLAPYYSQSQFYNNGGSFLSEEIQEKQNEAFEQGKKTATEFVKKDLYDEEKLVNTIYSNNTISKRLLGADPDDISVFGEKTDALAQSAGQLAATAGLQAVGVPWYLTTGITSFGSEAENALKEGATLEEAALSGAISAGAEILTEKISGGIKFGGKTLDDALVKSIARGISNKTVRTLTKLGFDAAGEGFEEVLSGAISAVGQKISYAEDKELSELFTKEEALESFIGGAVLGGGMSGISAIKAKKTGRDYVTGYTQNEQAVIDKEVEKRIAKAEANGKKLTTKEKNDLMERVGEDLKKGYVSTDTIEEVVNGEGFNAFKAERDKFMESDSFKQYKETVESEDAQIKDLEEQIKALEGDPNGGGNLKKLELQTKLGELKNSTKRAELQAQLDSEVKRINSLKNDLHTQTQKLVTGTHMAESYRELVRSNQKFTADLSEYKNESARKTIQNIMDSGLADNTNEFHERADWLAKISETTGLTFTLTKDDLLKGTEHNFEGARVNGFINEKTGEVTLNMDSENGMWTVVGHEVTHTLQQTKSYEKLKETLFNYAISKEGQEAFNQRLKGIEQLYQGKNTLAEQELVADLVGEYVFTDPDFVNDLATKNRNVFQQVYDEIKYMLKIATAGSKEARELEQAKRIFEKAWKESIHSKQTKTVTEEDAEPKYSLVHDKKTIDFLENQDHLTVYKAMVQIDGKLYPPMASQNYVEEEYTTKKGEKKTRRVRKLKNPSVLGQWQQSEEREDLITSFMPPSKKYPEGYGQFDLLKSNGKTTGGVAYNPYEHTSNIVLNDQFAEAYQRPELVTVEYEIPVSELTSGYKAKHAKDPVGLTDWKAGGVAQKLKNSHRDVYLTRWSKPVRVLSDAEVAQKYKDLLDNEEGIAVPWNVVTPSLREELEKLGVPIDYSDIKAGSTTRSFEAAMRGDYGKKGKKAESVQYSLGYHAGDLGKAEGYWNMVSSNRGTGHFGTGTYFVGDEAEIQDNYYGNRPHEKVDFDKYRLFKPLYEDEGFKLHSSLKYINDHIFDFPIASMDFDARWDVRKKADDAEYTLYFDDDATEAEKAEARKTIEELKEQFETVGYDPDNGGAEELYENLNDAAEKYRSVRSKLDMIFTRDMRNLSYDERRARIDAIMQGVYDEVSQIEDAYEARYEDSPSTRFMKAMGYEGIDVRGYKGLDNTKYGSVIYDLKGEDLDRKNALKAEKNTADGGVKYSLYSRPNFNKSDWEIVNRKKHIEFNNPTFDLDTDRKWMYANEKGSTVFAIYSKSDPEDPTVLYGTRGKDAERDYDKIVAHLRGGTNAKRGRAALDRLLANIQRNEGNRSDGISSSERAISAAEDVLLPFGESGSNGRGDYDNGREDLQAPLTENNVEASDDSDASFVTFSNDYATIRNFMKEGDTPQPEGDSDTAYSLSADNGKVKSYAEITEEQLQLSQRERLLEERKQAAHNNPELLQAMADYADLFTEMRPLLSKRRQGTATQAELDRIEEIKLLRDERMNRVAELQESLGLKAISDEETEIRETKEALRVAADAAWAREGAEKENKAIAKAGVSAEEYFRKKALKAFKTTTNFNEAGYLLPDGKLLNFSGGERNHRYRDHREIGEIYEATQGAAAMNRFMRDGNIRVMAESPGIDLTSGVEPTKEQYAALRKFINANGVADGQFFVDFSGADGEIAGKYEYTGRIIADRIINDIKYFYQNGKVRESSGLLDFLSISGKDQPVVGMYDAPLSKFKYEEPIAPVQEAAPVAEKVDVAANTEPYEEMFPDDTAPIQEEYEHLLAEREDIKGAMDAYAAVGNYDGAEQLMAEYEAVQTRIAEIEADDADRFASIDEADAPPEMDNMPEDVADDVPLTKALVADLAKQVKAQLGLGNRRTAEVRELIERYSKEEFPSKAHLFTEIQERFGTFTEIRVDEDLKDVKARLRTYGINVDDTIKADIADYGQLMRSNFGKVRFSKEGLPVDVAYREFQEVLPGYFPESIDVPTDQLLRIIEVANLETKTEQDQEIDWQTIEDAADTIMNTVAEFKQNRKETLANRHGRESFQSLMESADQYVPPYRVTTPPTRAEMAAPEEIAPTFDTLQGQQELFKNDPKQAEIGKRLARDKAKLQEEYLRQRAQIEAETKDKNAFISNKAKALYQEIRGLTKGVRASEELGYLLDYGYEWSAVKAALVNIQHTPDRTVNVNSEIENIARGMLNESYENRVYDIMHLETEYNQNVAKLEAEAEAEARGETKERTLTRKELHEQIVDDIKTTFGDQGYDFDEVLKNAKDLSTFATVDNTPQRVMEKALGYKEGQVLSDLTVNKVAQNETEGIRWLNSFTDKKSGLLAKFAKKYHIKPGSKESAAAQMYAEGFYVGENDAIIAYGDAELAKDFPDVVKQAQIKGLARDPRTRQIYDETLAAINKSRARNAYPEIPRLDNYYLHFRAMEDTFSRMGLPFNPNDIRAKDLPTDLNGVTADLKPGQPYFASAMHRTGKRTSFDLLGGLEKYLTSAKNQIYHIDDIQTLRALRNYVAETYGQAHGLENLDTLSDEEAEQRIKDVYDSHLSTFARFLNEEANVLAGKTSLIDRGLEGIIGRRGITFLDTVNRQVGANMVGFNVSSSLTNFLAPVQAFAKTNKFDFVKAMAQTAANKLGKGDNFAEESPVMIRRKGAERFYRTPYQKVADAGYVLMGVVDDISTELIARTKYNEFTRKGMDSQQAHIETDKWVSRLMGDRSLGQQPQLYNSKMLGLFTKFQLEVRNQLDSQFYDTIQEAKVSTEEIENKLQRNATKATKIASTFVQLAVMQHLFGKAFESVAGYNPAFDIIEALIKTFGWDDEEDDEDTVLDNLEQGFMSLLEDLPYTSTLTGGRIPISSALPVAEFIKGKDQYGNEKNRWQTLGEAAPYYVLPGGYGQIKKTRAGLKMFDEDLPIAGSYTDSGNLRFPVDDTLGSRVQAGLFGQWASENARDYFDNERAPLKEKQIQELIDTELPIRDYWDYREGLSKQENLEEKVKYIESLDLPIDTKNILVNNVTDRKNPIDLTDYDQYGDYEEFDFASKNPEKYDFLQQNNVPYEEYTSSEDAKEFYDGAYSWVKNNPEKVTVSKAVTDNVVQYRKYAKDLDAIRADKDADGKTISGSAKEKKLDYINSLDIDYGARLILFKNEYNADDTYNYEIIDYLNAREDISFDEMNTILKELGFNVTADGIITW